ETAAELGRPCSTARAGRTRLLRPPLAADSAAAGRSGPRARNSRLLLLLLLVQRPAPPRNPPRHDARERSTRLSVLRLLGQRELDPALGRARGRHSDRAGLFGGERTPSRRRPAAGDSRPALHPHQR